MVSVPRERSWRERAAAESGDRDERAGAGRLPGRAADLPAGEPRAGRPARLASLVRLGRHGPPGGGGDRRGGALPRAAWRRDRGRCGRGRPGPGAMIHDGRHAWLRITPAKVTSWDFRKLESL